MIVSTKCEVAVAIWVGKPSARTRSGTLDDAAADAEEAGDGPDSEPVENTPTEGHGVVKAVQG
jgi:hypothetical protein